MGLRTVSGEPSLASGSSCQRMMHSQLKIAHCLNFAIALPLHVGKPNCFAQPLPIFIWPNKKLESSEKLNMSLSEDSKTSSVVNRRTFAQLVLSSFSFYTLESARNPSPASAVPSLFASPIDLISRVGERAPKRPPEKLFGEDIYYPDFFAGVWKTESKMISVTCPSGYKLFGRPGTFEAAQRVSE